MYTQQALKLYFVFKNHISNGTKIDYEDVNDWGQKNAIHVESNKTLDKFIVGFRLGEDGKEVSFKLDLSDFQTFMLFLREQ
jgi:hypothetical protein